MWYESSNDNNVKPEAVDMESSRKWAYVRKNFRMVEEAESDGRTIPAHWEWLEMKLPKEALAIYTQGVENAGNVDVLTEAILEMSEIIYQ